MSSSALSDSEKDFYKEAYIRRLYTHGYPATKSLMEKFNKKFYDDHGLQGEKRHFVSALLQSFRNVINKIENPGASIIRRKPELKKILTAVVADCRRKQNVDDDLEDDEEEDDVDLDEEQLAKDDENSDMEEETVENEGAIAILENRNEELAKTLKMKDEECQQLEEKVRSLGEALQKESEHHLLTRLDVSKLQEENRSLKGALQKKTEEQGKLFKESDTTKLEEEIRSLKEALHEKDQMLKTALQVQHALSTTINKLAPQ